LSLEASIAKRSSETQIGLPLCFFGAVLLPLVAVLLDFAADGAFVAVKLFGDFGDGALEGQVLDGYRSSWVSCVWLIWKVALQI